MPLWIVHKNGRVKTADEVIDSIEEYIGGRLLPHQKLFVKALYAAETGNMLILMPRFLGYTQIKDNINKCKK